MTDWIKISQMKPEELEAATMVALLLLAMAEGFEDHGHGDIVDFLDTDLDKLFPHFAKSLGFSGPLYQRTGSNCPAVSIYFGKETRNMMLFLPYPSGTKVDRSILDRRADRKEICEEALKLCAILRPGWDWPEN